ncbi:MAG: hypothetical protein A3B38_02865 [Candidatus Levybacteria bacterium RIFCSPLOWO2_01_FULL_36_13]|nr:MAG: hypothetical protein A2684_03955 [Candidatus Levybacteria bacterium RIFCSPHIGHO2_01_FULL_36_15b]OGH35834.1 MAG: hypothetical protein A3B38_02865 [Candidatus Levybacteria bacterium RIFCSPLOWO2_01_FULL_36_13]
MKRIFITITILVFSLLVLVAFNNYSSNNKPQPKSNLTRVKIAFSPYVSPFFVAIDKGIFEKYGIKAELVSIPSSNNAMYALSKGDIDVVSAPYSVFFAYENAVPGEFKIFSGVIETLDKPYSFLIVKKDINSIGELKGKKILTRSGTNGKMQAELVLKGLGINLDEVEIVQVSSTLTAQTFVKPDIAAAIDNEPSSTSIVQKAGGKILIEAVRPKYLTNPYASTGNAFSTKFAKNKDLADRFTRANDEAIDYSRKNDKEFRSINQKYIKLDKEIIFAMPESVFEKSTELNKTAIKNEMQLELDNGILEKAVDLSNVYYK